MPNIMHLIRIHASRERGNQRTWLAKRFSLATFRFE
jgi:hypothetical protein